MKQQHLVIVLFVLMSASFATSFHGYRAAEERVCQDMNRALALTLSEQQTDAISQDTIARFNNHLQIADLRGRATIAVDTRPENGLSPKAVCSMGTIFSLSDQRPATLLWTLTLLWIAFGLYVRRRNASKIGLQLVGGHFVAANGKEIRLTPMQQQLMELFWKAPDHKLTREAICATLWPGKPDANDTLYTLIRRLRTVIEANTQLKIETDRGRSYALRAKQ